MNVNVQKKCTAKVFLTVNLEKATVSVVFAAYVVFTLYKFIFYSFLPVHIVPSVVFGQSKRKLFNMLVENSQINSK